MRENTIAKTKSNDVKISASHNAVVIYQDLAPQIKLSGSAQLIKTTTTKHDINTFADIYPPNSEIFTLYKSVNPETFCDFYSGTIKYEVGKTITCPDWDSNPERECGGGLHLSPTPELALTHNNGKLLVCEVNKKDIAVYHGNIRKVRCKQVKVIREYISDDAEAI